MRYISKQLNKLILLSILALVAFGLQLADTQAAAGINTQINYQGKLNNKAAGTAVNDRSWRMRLRLYDAATNGALLWTERWSTTTVEVNTVNGIFSVALGTYTSLDSVDFNSDSLYLQIDMDADELAGGDW